MNWKNILSKNKNHILRIFACIVVVLVFATLVTPAFSIDDKTADEEPGLDTQETATTEEKSVNELENVADPFVIEAQREETYNNAQAETEEKDIPSDTVVSEEETTDTNEQAEVTDVVSTTPEEEKVEEEEDDDVITFFDDSTDITVYIEAPYDAFPEGTYMVVTPVESEEVIDSVNNALDDNTKVKRVEAVDITFYDLDDNEVEPAKEIKVSLKSKFIEQSEDAKVVHIDNNGDGKLMDLHEDSDDDEVKFSAEGFSTYVVVETETIETKYIAADGETYSISVTYSPDAEIPEGSELVVKEITDENEYQEYYSQALDTLYEQYDEVDISYARFFDIEIQFNGEKIEPKASVEVKITNGDEAYELNEDDSINVIHFVSEEKTELIDEIEISVDGKEIIYDQDSFSVTGEVAGTFSGNNWPSCPAGDYVLIVYSGNGGPYYAVNSSGGLVEVTYDPVLNSVTFPDSAAVTTEDLSDYWWTYYVNGGNHRLTSVANTNNKFCPVQNEGGSAISNSTNSPGANQGYIYRGSQNYRYCVAINSTGTSLVSSHVTYSNGYYYPSNAAHFIFVNSFVDDPTGAYGTASSTILTGNSKTLRMAEVTTDDEELIDFEHFTWTSSNPSVATVSKDPDTDAPIATAVAVGTTRIIGTRTNEHGEIDEVIWTVTVKEKTSNSIVFLHQPQDNANFANQDNIRPHDGYGDTEPTNYVKFVVALADENGNIITYQGRPNVELPEGSVVPDRYEFELDSTGVFTIENDTLSGISVPGYSYAGTYAYFGWYNNTDLENMAVVDDFKNMGAVSSRYPNYYSVLGFKTSRGNPQYQDYSQTAFGQTGYGYYAYNPTGVLMIVLQPVSEHIAYRTSYHNDYVPGGPSRINIVDTTNSRMIQGEWIPDEYRHDWYGETIMTTKTGNDLVSPADGYEFVGWFDSVDPEGNGTGNQIIGQTEDGYFYAMKNGEKIIIRQNNDIYAKWQLVRGTLTVRKVIKGDLTDSEIVTLKDNLAFTVTDNQTQVETPVSGQNMTWNGNTGTYDVTGLSAATTYTIAEIESSAIVENYEKVTEKNNTENVKVSKTSAVVSTITNTYTKMTADIIVIKKSSEDGMGLSGAVFDVYRPATSSDTDVVTVDGITGNVVKVDTITTGPNGQSDMNNISIGDYYFVETKAPDGYQQLDKVIAVTVTKNAITLKSGDHASVDGLTLTITNDSGIELPATGSSGTLLLTLGGMTLILSSALMYLFGMRRNSKYMKERRVN